VREAILYGSVQAVQQGKRAQISRQTEGTKFKAVLRVFLLQQGHTDQAIQPLFSTVFEVLEKSRAVQQYGFLGTVF
jgi:hypothetical protein